MEIGVEPPSLPPSFSPSAAVVGLAFGGEKGDGNAEEKKPTRWGGRLSSQPDDGRSRQLAAS